VRDRTAEPLDRLGRAGAGRGGEPELRLGQRDPVLRSAGQPFQPGDGVEQGRAVAHHVGSPHALTIIPASRIFCVSMVSVDGLAELTWPRGTTLR
jgi:hypothetical protein